MIKKILILVFLMIITVGCNSNKQNNVKKFTSSEISLRGSGDYGGPYSVKFTVLLTKYENIVYTKVEMNFGKYDHLETMKMDNDFFEEEQGKESLPTYYHYHQQERPFHIDFCFLSQSLMNTLQNIEVGKFDDWMDLSDHVPMIIEY